MTASPPKNSPARTTDRGLLILGHWPIRLGAAIVLSFALAAPAICAEVSLPSRPIVSANYVLVTNYVVTTNWLPGTNAIATATATALLPPLTWLPPMTISTGFSSNPASG